MDFWIFELQYIKTKQLKGTGLWIFEIQYINTIKSINKFHYQDFDVTIVNSI